MTPQQEDKEKVLDPLPLKKIIILIWDRIPKAFVWTLLSAIIIGSVSMSYAFVKTTDNTNKSVPAYQSQTTQIQNAVTSLTLGQAEMKKDIDNTDKNFSKFQDIVDDALKRINDRLDRVLLDTKEIKNSTK